nr:hypothetical protein [Roseivivax jejudonensis]
MTAQANVPGIVRHGLLPAATLARACGVDPRDIILRSERRALRGPAHAATLNHQLPILHGRAAADRIVDGHDAASWAELLDARVFFWPERAMRAFGRSLARDLDALVLWFDTARLLAAAPDRFALSPINSGNFRQGGAHARRGAWLFVPVVSGLDAFRVNRQRHGAGRGRDAVREVSLCGALAPEAVAAARIE